MRKIHENECLVIFNIIQIPTCVSLYLLVPTNYGYRVIPSKDDGVIYTNKNTYYYKSEK